MAVPSSTRRHLAVLSAALLTGACASVPNLGPKPTPAAAASLPAAQSLAGSTAEWPGGRWWESYGDAQLDALIGEGLVGSPDLAAAAARFRRAQGFAQAAGARLLPSVDAAASVSELNPPNSVGVPLWSGFKDFGNAGIGFGFDLDLWGKNRAALRAAKKDVEAARFDAEEARLMLTTGIAATYADLAALYAQHDSLERALDVRARSLALVKQRVDAGLDNDSALRLAEARIPQTKAELAATDEAIMLAKHALAALVGTGPDRALAITRPAPGKLQAHGLPAGASIELIGRRPDLAAARTRVEAASDRIKEARAAFYPNVSVSALAGFASLGLSDLFKSGSGYAGVTPAISLPIFHGGALQGNYRGSRGSYDEAVALYDAQLVQALRQTADAVTSRQALAERLAHSRSALASYEGALRLAQLRYEKGLSTYLDVLTAQEGVVSARLAVAQLETRAFTLDVQLVRALGGGFADA
ncbi:MAG: efflux transporter outer membrane subunit [Alphaproteobacteria bacterium]|nr:efflux transporter outer membrane subunit [Alphaproteobacteria bacterium]